MMADNSIKSIKALMLINAFTELDKILSDTLERSLGVLENCP